ncbi:MAG: DHH family phosphoesterase, partial [Candidatus Peribacteraceae bacterium]|nr:DHH family phosphoesterase [Candidatus Peribacteraceae bacterium]
MIQKAAQLIVKAQRVVCICHANPDGDAIGALLGMGHTLEKAYPEKQILFFCKDPAPEIFQFLFGVERVQTDVLLQDGDVIVFLDIAEPKLTGLLDSHSQLFEDSTLSINIDHHPTNVNFGTVNLIDPDAASACEIVVEIADGLGWELDSDIATCLLTGVYTDTGGLL